MDIEVNGRMNCSKASRLYWSVRWRSDGLEIRVDDHDNPEPWVGIRAHYHAMRELWEKIQAARPKCGCPDRDPIRCVEIEHDIDRSQIDPICADGCPCECHEAGEDGETAWDKGDGVIRDRSEEEIQAAMEAMGRTIRDSFPTRPLAMSTPSRPGARDDES